MKREQWRNQNNQSGLIFQTYTLEIPITLKISCLSVLLNSDPIIERLQRQVQVGRGLQLQDCQTAAPVDRQEVEHASLPAGESRHLSVDRIGLERSIERLDLCTACHPDLFFSHRRDAGVTGRQGVIGHVTR